MARTARPTSLSSRGRNALSQEPGDKLTLIWNAPESGDAMQVNFVNERELVVWPNGDLDDLVILFNGGPSKGRSWTFTHKDHRGRTSAMGRKPTCRYCRERPSEKRSPIARPRGPGYLNTTATVTPNSSSTRNSPRSCLTRVPPGQSRVTLRARHPSRARHPRHALDAGPVAPMCRNRDGSAQRRRERIFDGVRNRFPAVAMIPSGIATSPCNRIVAADAERDAVILLGDRAQCLAKVAQIGREIDSLRGLRLAQKIVHSRTSPSGGPAPPETMPGPRGPSAAGPVCRAATKRSTGCSWPDD